MIASVVKVEFNQQLGKYKVTKLTVKAENGKLNTHNIFPSSPYNNLVRDLQPGDTINLTMEKKNDYWNIAGISKVEGQSEKPSKVSSPTSSGYSGGVQRGKSPEETVAIARAVCIKAAVETFAALVANGAVKKTIKPDAAALEILSICKKFEGYLTLSEDLADLTSDPSSISTEGSSSFEETPFE